MMGDRLAPGRYRAELTLGSGADSAEVEMGGSPKASRVTGKSALVDVTEGFVQVTIRPNPGPVVACGFTLNFDGSLP
jgi:hypothetical protein